MRVKLLACLIWIIDLTHLSGEGGTGGGKTSTGLIVGVAVGCVILVVGLVCVGVYALLQKKKARRALEQSRPFGNYFVTFWIIHKGHIA